METSHFDSQLLPGERVLWHGQPDKEAFARDEQHLINWIVASVVTWSIACFLYLVWKHSLPYFLHGGFNFIFVPLGLALVAKAYRERKIHFQHIEDAAEACALLAGLTTHPASV